MRNATLLFLIKNNEVCLAMKKIGFGKGRWNGAGGKVEEGESIEDATLREVKEEVCVTVKNIKKVAELEFTFVKNPEWNQTVHVFTATEWEGIPSESEEMKPSWHKSDNLPLADMWPADTFWLPKVLKGELIKASFTLGDQNTILNKKVETVAAL